MAPKKQKKGHGGNPKEGKARTSKHSSAGASDILNRSSPPVPGENLYLDDLSGPHGRVTAIQKEIMYLLKLKTFNLEENPKLQESFLFTIKDKTELEFWKDFYSKEVIRSLMQNVQKRYPRSEYSYMHWAAFFNIPMMVRSSVYFEKEKLFSPRVKHRTLQPLMFN